MDIIATGGEQHLGGRDFNDRISEKLLQGNDGQDVKDCTALGYFELKDLPPRPDLIGRIEITFTLDANGILSAKARDVVSGKQSEMEIDYNNGISANQTAA